MKRINRDTWGSIAMVLLPILIITMVLLVNLLATDTSGHEDIVRGVALTFVIEIIILVVSLKKSEE